MSRPSAPLPGWHGVREAAKLLGCGVDTMYRLARQGRITVLHVPGTSMRFSAADIERLLAESVRPRKEEGT